MLSNCLTLPPLLTSSSLPTITHTIPPYHHPRPVFFPLPSLAYPAPHQSPIIDLVQIPPNPPPPRQTPLRHRRHRHRPRPRRPHQRRPPHQRQDRRRKDPTHREMWICMSQYYLICFSLPSYSLLHPPVLLLLYTLLYLPSYPSPTLPLFIIPYPFHL